MEINWLNLLGAGFAGGLFVKIIDYIYLEYIRRNEENKTVKNLINRHIDPILKSTDELVGKIRSLAQSDFRELVNARDPKESNFESWVPYLNLIYLFAQFWSRIQILSIESLFVNLGSDRRGKQLLDFIKALESTKTRLVERSWQRGMGESLIEYTNNGVRSITYFEFVHKFLTNDEYRKWYQPFVSSLMRINHKREKQRFLLYGVILHALIDTLDNKHLVTHNRPGWANKLTTKSMRNLRYRLFRVYLPFVPNPKRYYSVSSN